MRALPLAALVATGLAVPSASAAPAAWTARPATYAATVTSDVRVTMSDGVRLAVDVIAPDAPGRFPVVLTQTPYNKNGPLGFRSDYLVTRGYVQVVADVRGTGSSEGVWHSFDKREQQDGLELVRW